MVAIPKSPGQVSRDFVGMSNGEPCHVSEAGSVPLEGRIPGLPFLAHTVAAAIGQRIQPGRYVLHAERGAVLAHRRIPIPYARAVIPSCLVRSYRLIGSLPLRIVIL